MDFFGDQLGHVFVRTAVMFLIALVVVRLMGSRTLGQMTPFDYVILVGIGDIVANVALDTEEKLWTGAEALLMLLILDFVLSYVSLKNRKFRRLVEGSPVPLIKDGRVLRENLSKAHFNNDDLRQEMHKLGMELDKIKDVKRASLEGCGHFTVVKKPAAEPVTLQDMQNMLGNSVIVSQATLAELIKSVNCLIDELKGHRSNTGSMSDVEGKTDNSPNGVH